MFSLLQAQSVLVKGNYNYMVREETARKIFLCYCDNSRFLLVIGHTELAIN